MPDEKNAENSSPVDATRYIPLVGRIAAGGPITAEQEIEETFPLPESLVGSGDLFMLKVVGESMIEAAICDGDFVVIRSQKDCNNGEIVAAMIDEEAPSDGRARVNLDPREPARDVRHEARRPLESRAPQGVRHPMEQDRVQARITGQHFPSCASSRIAVKNALNVGTDA